jgi:hypothetical protein
MQTADWALVISLCSAGVSLASFIWNVWSKFIYPKPVVQVSFQMMRSIYPAQGVVGGQVLALIATNMGPAQVTLRTAICRRRKRFPFLKTRSFFLLSPIPNYPQDTELSIGPFAGGLPKKLEVGEQFTAYFIPDHEGLAKGEAARIGFDDTFGTLHWAPRSHIRDALPEIREACKRAGKNWQNPEQA